MFCTLIIWNDNNNNNYYNDNNNDNYDQYTEIYNNTTRRVQMSFETGLEMGCLSFGNAVFVKNIVQLFWFKILETKREAYFQILTVISRVQHRYST